MKTRELTESIKKAGTQRGFRAEEGVLKDLQEYINHIVNNPSGEKVSIYITAKNCTLVDIRFTNVAIAEVGDTVSRIYVYTTTVRDRRVIVLSPDKIYFTKTSIGYNGPRLYIENADRYIVFNYKMDEYTAIVFGEEPPTDAILDIKRSTLVEPEFVIDLSSGIECSSLIEDLIQISDNMALAVLTYSRIIPLFEKVMGDITKNNSKMHVYVANIQEGVINLGDIESGTMKSEIMKLYYKDLDSLLSLLRSDIVRVYFINDAIIFTKDEDIYSNHSQGGDMSIIPMGRYAFKCRYYTGPNRNFVYNSMDLNHVYPVNPLFRFVYKDHEWVEEAL